MHTNPYTAMAHAALADRRGLAKVRELLGLSTNATPTEIAEAIQNSDPRVIEMVATALGLPKDSRRQDVIDALVEMEDGGHAGSAGESSASGGAGGRGAGSGSSGGGNSGQSGLSVDEIVSHPNYGGSCLALSYAADWRENAVLRARYPNQSAYVAEELRAFERRRLNPAALQQQFYNSAALQAEFGEFEVYRAYCEAEARGGMVHR